MSGRRRGVVLCCADSVEDCSVACAQKMEIDVINCPTCGHCILSIFLKSSICQDWRQRTLRGVRWLPNHLGHDFQAAKSKLLKVEFLPAEFIEAMMKIETPSLIRSLNVKRKSHLFRLLNTPANQKTSCTSPPMSFSSDKQCEN